MDLKSPGLRTDLIFSRFSGEIIDRGDYIVIKSPLRPNYFWGNYIIMPEAPRKGDLTRWQALYNTEFNSARQGFMTFAVDTGGLDLSASEEFISAGFRQKTNIVLTANEVTLPPKKNSEVVVREIQTEEDWQQLVEVHFSDEWYLNPESQRPFLMQKAEDLRAMGVAGLGKRFGAFLGDKLVADLGIYKSGNLGRFNEVATHRKYRRRGLCGTLVYQSALVALEKMGIDLLVMEADEDYHAAEIYASVGFKPTFRQIGFEWYDRAIHG